MYRLLESKCLYILQSIDGIGPVFAGGIIAEIGDITAFHSSDALAKYAGLTWKSNQSGDFDGEYTPMIKAGNRYLRYYLGEVANSMRKHNVEYGAYYRKKYNEVPKHQHKRALALTSRKFVCLVYGLLARNQLYSGVSLDTSIKDSNWSNLCFAMNHRSIKVTLFSEIHIKIISKISLTYHQIAFWVYILKYGFHL